MATEIPLTQGQVALVDDADAEWLNQWKWTASRCHRDKFVALRGERVGGKHRNRYMHREILGLSPGDGLEADHWNHDTLDNRRSNLRIVTPTENKVRVPSRGGSSRFVGVTYDKARNRWRAQIQVEGTVRNLGRYATEMEAAAARDAYVREHNTGHSLNLAA